MLRYVVWLITALSFLLLVGSTFVWAKSHWIREEVGYWDNDRPADDGVYLVVVAEDGELNAIWHHELRWTGDWDVSSERRVEGFRLEWRREVWAEEIQSHWELMGAGYARRQAHSEFSFPIWLIALIAGLLPAWKAVRACRHWALLRRSAGESRNKRARMGGALFTFAALVSLVAMVLVGGHWLRSYYILDRITVWEATEVVSVDLYYGHIVFNRHNNFTDEVRWEIESFAVRRPAVSRKVLLEGATSSAYFLGLGYGWFTRGDNWAVNILIPYWFVFVALLVLPVWWCLRFRRRCRRLRQTAQGCCARCGYDLRGTTTATCAECGWPRAIAVI